MSPHGRRRLDFSQSPMKGKPEFHGCSDERETRAPWMQESGNVEVPPRMEERPCQTFDRASSSSSSTGGDEENAVSLGTVPAVALREREKEQGAEDPLSTQRESNMPTQRGPNWSDVVTVDEIENVSKLLRSNGMQSLNMNMHGSAITLSQKDVIGRMTDIIRLYGERGATIEELITKSRAPEAEMLTKNSNLAAINKDLQYKLELSKKQLSKAQDAEALRSKCDSEKRILEQQLGDLQLKVKGMEAMLKSKDRDMEKLKAKLDRCITQDRRRPEKEQKLDSLYEETVSLTKQLFLLSKEKEVQDREVDKLRKQLILTPKLEPPQPVADNNMATSTSNLINARALDRRKIEELEARLERECSLRESTEKQLWEQKRALEFELKNMSEEVQSARDRERQRPVDQALLQEVQRLRDVEAEARRRWKSLDAKELMSRDKEMKKLNLLKTDFGLSRDEAVDILKKVMHKFNLDSSLLDELLPRIDRLIAAGRRKQGIDAECQTVEATDSLASEILASLKADTGEKALGRLETLKTHAVLLATIGSRVGARRPNDVLSAVDRVLQVCDEHTAARKIVDTLQSFFNIDSMELVMPTIKDELSRRQTLDGS